MVPKIVFREHKVIETELEAQIFIKTVQPHGGYG